MGRRVACVSGVRRTGRRVESGIEGFPTGQ